MRKISIFMLCVFFASGALAAQKKAGKPKEGVNKAAVGKTVVSEVPVEKPVAWSLSAYPEHDGYLPRGYQGVDPIKFWEFFNEKVSAIRKDELETQEEFERRKADVDSVLFPAKASDLYAFWKPDILVWYDVVGHYFVFRSKDDRIFCDENSSQWNTCRIATVENTSSSYLGSFAQGKATVKRAKTTDFSLAILKANHFFQSSSVIYDFTRMGLDYLIRMPAESAKNLKGNKIGVLFVGRLAGAEIIAGKGSVTLPTFSDPTDSLIQEEAVPFDLKKIVFYVVETGQILESRDIQP